MRTEAIPQRSPERPGRRGARALAWLWTAADAVPGAIEIYREDGHRTMFDPNIWLRRHYGNFAPSELATLVGHGAEEVAIRKLGLPELPVRVAGFLFVALLNVWVETPGLSEMLGYRLGAHNPEFTGDVLSGLLGYAAAKAPLLIFSYLSRTRATRQNEAAGNM